MKKKKKNRKKGPIVKRKPPAPFVCTCTLGLFCLCVCVWLKCPKSVQILIETTVCVYVYMRKSKKACRLLSSAHVYLKGYYRWINLQSVCHGELTFSAQMFTQQHTEEMLWPFSVLILFIFALFFFFSQSWLTPMACTIFCW